MMTHILMPATSSSPLIAAVPSLPSPVVLAYIAAAILFILAAAGLSRHETAVAGHAARGNAPRLGVADEALLAQAQAQAQPVRHQAPAPAASGKRYKNCRAVWNELGRPIRSNEPGYGRHLDRDGDGVGCERRPR